MTGYYVAVQELTGIFRIKLVYGPFATSRAAGMMTGPVRAALGPNSGLNVITHRYTAKTLPQRSMAISQDALIKAATICR